MKKLLIAVLALFFGLLFHESSSVQAGADQGDAAKLKQAERNFRINCMPCHMPLGKSPIKKLNLADDLWRHGGKLPQIEKTITEGIKGTPMRPFKDKLTKEQIQWLARYVKSFSKDSGKSSE